MRARVNAGAAGDGGQSRSRLRFDCQRNLCSGSESSGASAASMGTVSICSGARSVYSGADSVCSGTGFVVLSGALCSTGAASSVLKVEKRFGLFGFGLRFCGQAFESAFGRAVLIEGGRSVGRSFGRSVQNGYARAVRRSVAMMSSRVVMPALV